jgi:hypothetical protein
MKSQTKAIKKGGLFGGILFALGMAEFDFSDDKSFNVWKFILNSSFLGIFMGLLTSYNLRKQLENQKTE